MPPGKLQAKSGIFPKFSAVRRIRTGSPRSEGRLLRGRSGTCRAEGGKPIMAVRAAVTGYGDLTSKNDYFRRSSLRFSTLWHYPRRNPTCAIWGKNGEKAPKTGKKRGSFLSVYQPSSEPGIKPSSLTIRRRHNVSPLSRICQSEAAFPRTRISNRSALSVPTRQSAEDHGFNAEIGTICTPSSLVYPS